MQQQEKNSIFKMGKRSGHHTKEDKHMVNEDMKGYSMWFATGEVQIKTTMRFHHTPIRMAKILRLWLKHWQHQMLPRMWSNRNTYSLLMGMQNGEAILEDNLAISYKVKHTVIIWSSNCGPRYLPHWSEKLCQH